MSTHENENQAETIQERAPPRIYVADLAAYNNGHLHGVWLDANREEDEIWEDINDMLSKSPVTAEADEIAIHDYEGFGGWQVSENRDIGTVSVVATAIEEHGEAISHWIEYLEHDPYSAIASFEDAYLGNWRDMTHYTEELVDDLGCRITVEPESWRHYVRFDTAALARDLEFDLHVAEDGDGGIHIFRPDAADGL